MRLTYPTSLKESSAAGYFPVCLDRETQQNQGFQSFCLQSRAREFVYVIGLRKKQDTPKVVYFTPATSRSGRSQ